MPRLFLWSLALLSSGCFLPLTSAAPQSATTLGKGHFGVTGYAEFPSVNQVATAKSSAPIVPGLTGVLQVGFGISDQLDLELGGEGMMFLFILPLPTGVNGGVRYQALETDNWNVAVAGRAGYSGVSGTYQQEKYSIRSIYGMASGTAQFVRWNIFRPGLSLSLYPAQVAYQTDTDRGEYTTFTGSATLNLTVRLAWFELTPFGGVVFFHSPHVQKTEFFGQAGLSLALRPSKKKAPPPPVVPTPPPAEVAPPPVETTPPPPPPQL